jgi:lysophospholipase L1-like esterase
MKLKFLSALALLIAASAPTMKADEAFRLHRYDSFRATPTVAGQTVFAGNSITNMGNWSEAFGCDGRIINRGNSGGFSFEIVQNLESYIDCRPSRFFLMIGTNDINAGYTPKSVAENIRNIVTRVHAACDTTKIYVQSIMPRGGTVWTTCQTANTLIKAVCDSLPYVTFIDNTTAMAGVINNTTYTYDYLHPNGVGFRTWCNFLAPTVTGLSASSFEQTQGNNPGTLGANSNGAKLAEFGLLNIDTDDIVILGDEMINGGEWAELLRSPKVKARGVCWGYGSVGLSGTKSMVTVSLGNHSGQKDPKKVFLYAGLSECNAGTDTATVTASYKEVISEVHTQAPQAEVYIMSMIPHSNSTYNGYAQTMNTALQGLANTDAQVTYVDIFTPLANADKTPNSKYITSNYVYGLGYVRIANELAKYMTDCGVNPWSEDDVNVRYAARVALNTAGQRQFGNLPGQYSAAGEAATKEAMSALRDAIYSGSNTDITAKTESLNSVIANPGDMALPQASTADEAHWYRLTSNRGTRSMVETSSNTVVGTQMSSDDVSSEGYDLWKFEAREDGGYNIVNYATGRYLTPYITHNTQMKTIVSAPAQAWKLGAAAVESRFVIYSSGTTNCQLNQTNLTDTPVYNWFGTASFPNTTDEGCTYSIVPFTGKVVEAPSTGWFEIELNNDLGSYVTNGTHHMVNADAEYEQTTSNYYALAFAAKPTQRPAKGFIHITIADGTWQFTSLNGHGVQENCTSSRESLPSSNPAITLQSDGSYAIGKWSNFVNTGAESPYVGKSSSSSNTYNISRLTSIDLAPYDEWTVSIANAENGTTISCDARITLDIDANRGITTVYNGGTYFLAKGATFSASDIQVIQPVGASVTNDKPYIGIDSAARTITVDFSKQSSVAELNAEKPAAASRIFDLQGRELRSAPATGIYIVDGQKIRI